MKLNNKGFAISVILYSIIILIIGILYLLIDILNARYNLSKHTTNEIVDYLNIQNVNIYGVTKVINTGQLLYVPETSNYYYYGKNPDNFIDLNGDLWRIIGVFTIDNTKYLKIIKNDPLKLETTDNFKIFDSNIFRYLNNDFYNSINFQEMVTAMYWSVSEYSSNLTPIDAFNEEKNYLSSLQANVGLINGSDFGFAAGSEYLQNSLSNYSVSKDNNWLAFSNKYFTMSSNDSKINIINDGNLVNTDNNEAYIYPCLYLRNDIYIISGTGKMNDPYTLLQ